MESLSSPYRPLDFANGIPDLLYKQEEKFRTTLESADWLSQTTRATGADADATAPNYSSGSSWFQAVTIKYRLVFM